jgi:transcriptional regulator with XRE-family HTH domain
MASASPYIAPRDVTIGQHVALLRKSRHLKQGDLAAQITAAGHSITNSTISKTELGERVVRPAELAAFARFFGLRPSDLSGDPADDAPAPLLPQPKAAPVKPVVAPAEPVPAPAATSPAQATAPADYADALARMAAAIEELVGVIRAAAAPAEETHARLVAVGD